MTTEHRRAPRRNIVSISRTGAWGKVTYEHTLECGHVERRPRAATSKQLACAWCLRSRAKEIEIRALGTPAESIDFQPGLKEIEIAKVKAQLSHVLGVTLEQIEISVIDRFGEQKISGAVVVLSGEDVRKLIG